MYEAEDALEEICILKTPPGQIVPVSFGKSMFTLQLKPKRLLSCQSKQCDLIIVNLMKPVKNMSGSYFTPEHYFQKNQARLPKSVL